MWHVTMGKLSDSRSPCFLTWTGGVSIVPVLARAYTVRENGYQMPGQVAQDTRRHMSSLRVSELLAVSLGHIQAVGVLLLTLGLGTMNSWKTKNRNLGKRGPTSDNCQRLHSS